MMSWQPIRHERIYLPLSSKRRRWPVARNESHVSSKREQILANRADQILMISPREIGSADGAREQHVTNERKPRGRMKKYDMSRCMAGTVPHLERFSSHANLIPLSQPSIRHEAVAFRETVLPCLPRQVLNEELIVRVRPFDRHSFESGKFGRRRGMVQMTMGDQDLLQGKSLARQYREHSIQVTARIHHSRKL
jgi:hypothetical protein